MRKLQKQETGTDPQTLSNKLNSWLQSESLKVRITTKNNNGGEKSFFFSNV